MPTSRQLCLDGMTTARVKVPSSPERQVRGQAEGPIGFLGIVQGYDGEMKKL